MTWVFYCNWTSTVLYIDDAKQYRELTSGKHIKWSVSVHGKHVYA